jgi:hypothetical protein
MINALSSPDMIVISSALCRGLHEKVQLATQKQQCVYDRSPDEYHECTSCGGSVWELTHDNDESEEPHFSRCVSCKYPKWFPAIKVCCSCGEAQYDHEHPNEDRFDFECQKCNFFDEAGKI